MKTIVSALAIDVIPVLYSYHSLTSSINWQRCKAFSQTVCRCETYEFVGDHSVKLLRASEYKITTVIGFNFDCGVTSASRKQHQRCHTLLS